MSRITRAAARTAPVTEARVAIAAPHHTQPPAPGSDIPASGYDGEVNTDAAVVMAEFERFDGRLIRGLGNGLVAGQRGTVTDGVADLEERALAQTGTSLQAIALRVGAALSLALGAGLVLARTLRAATRTTC